MANRIDGNVSFINSSGSLVTDISNESLADVPTGETTQIKFGDFETFGLFPSEHQQPDATMVAYLGKSGFLEIEIVGIALAEMLGVRQGESVAVTW